MLEGSFEKKQLPGNQPYVGHSMNEGTVNPAEKKDIHHHHVTPSLTVYEGGNI